MLELESGNGSRRKGNGECEKDELELHFDCFIVIVSNASSFVSISFVNSLKSVCPK
jgi:hypothetical protein